jgi:hypothetical protein
MIQTETLPTFPQYQPSSQKNVLLPLIPNLYKLELIAQYAV